MSIRTNPEIFREFKLNEKIQRVFGELREMSNRAMVNFIDQVITCKARVICPILFFIFKLKYFLKKIMYVICNMLF